MKKKIAILGSTGSIGKSLLSLLRKDKNKKIILLSANKNYRAELNRARRKDGNYGKGGKDYSHTRKGTLVREDPSTNRARNRSKK